jgi:hypothetical protein
MQQKNKLIEIKKILYLGLLYFLIIEYCCATAGEKRAYIYHTTRQQMQSEM